jgi:membrane dipeptidase
LGTAVVGEMNRIGMAVDVSHCGERTSLETIEASTKPVLVTHSNCAALSPGQPRCKSDRVLRAMAAGGGVIGMTIVRSFVKRGGRPTLSDLLDHFEHVARLVGVEHVGLGTDVDVDALDPATGLPHPLYQIRGLDPRARVFQIAEGLLARGYSAVDVEKVLGGNFLRALAAIWPDASWQVIPQRDHRRDPFCPAPWPRAPGEGAPAPP